MDLKQEYKELVQQMRALADEDRLNERNALLPRIKELQEQIDWGFQKREVVERRTGRGWEEDVILDIEDNQYRFRTVILPPQMIRKKQAKQEKPEQLTLF